MEEVDVIIVGQGIAGSWLGWWLHEAGFHFLTVDNHSGNSASMRAAGLINPVTGRRMVTTWMIEELMPFASEAYKKMEIFLGTNFFEAITLIDFFPSVQMLQSFQKHYEEDPAYLLPGLDREKYSDLFHYDLGWGSIQPCFLVGVEKFLTGWRSWLDKNGLIIESLFDQMMLQTDAKGIQYAGIHARYIVFCDGVSSAQNPYFAKLPFALNKGEGLLVEIKGLPSDLVFKKGMSLIPVKENIFWLGSSYEWNFTDVHPSDLFKKTAASWLKNNLRLPYKIIDHFAALRPATLERRPFVGFHHLHPKVGIVNGLGTKGCSLAPYFAKQLVDKLSGNGEINPLAEISRFEKILGR